MNPDGQGVAVWLAHRGDALRMEAARFHVDGRWGEPQRLLKSWSQSAAWVGVDGVARVVFEQPQRITWIRYAEHRPGEGWADSTRIGVGKLADGAREGADRMVYTAVDGDEVDGYRLWASALDAG